MYLDGKNTGKYTYIPMARSRITYTQIHLSGVVAALEHQHRSMVVERNMYTATASCTIYANSIKKNRTSTSFDVKYSNYYENQVFHAINKISKINFMCNN